MQVWYLQSPSSNKAERKYRAASFSSTCLSNSTLSPQELSGVWHHRGEWHIPHIPHTHTRTHTTLTLGAQAHTNIKVCFTLSSYASRHTYTRLCVNICTNTHGQVSITSEDIKKSYIHFLKTCVNPEHNYYFSKPNPSPVCTQSLYHVINNVTFERQVQKQIYVPTTQVIHIYTHIHHFTCILYAAFVLGHLWCPQQCCHVTVKTNYTGKKWLKDNNASQWTMK